MPSPLSITLKWQPPHQQQPWKPRNPIVQPPQCHRSSENHTTFTHPTMMQQQHRELCSIFFSQQQCSFHTSSECEPCITATSLAATTLITNAHCISLAPVIASTPPTSGNPNSGERKCTLPCVNLLLHNQAGQ